MNASTRPLERVSSELAVTASVGVGIAIMAARIKTPHWTTPQLRGAVPLVAAAIAFYAVAEHRGQHAALWAFAQRWLVDN